MVSQLQLVLSKIIMPANDYLIHGDKEERLTFENLDAEVNRLFEMLEGKYYLTRIMVDEQALLSHLKSQYASIKNLSEKIFHLPSPLGNEEGARLMEEMDSLTDNMLENMKELHRSGRRNALVEVEVIGDYFYRYMTTIVSTLAFIVIASLFYGQLLTKSIIAPIRSLIEYIEFVARGDFSHRLDIKTKDEIDQLSRAFNQMSTDLEISRDKLVSHGKYLEEEVQKRTRNLEDARAGLKKAIEERTKELLERVSDLERYHDATVDRELRMKEMRVRIEELEARLKGKEANIKRQ